MIEIAIELKGASHGVVSVLIAAKRLYLNGVISRLRLIRRMD